MEAAAKRRGAAACQMTRARLQGAATPTLSACSPQTGLA